MSGGDKKGPEQAASSSPGVMQLFGQMLLFPFTVFVYGMELLMKTVRGMQQTMDQGMEVMVGESATPARPTPSGEDGSNQTVVSGDARQPISAEGGWSDLKVETKSSTGGAAGAAAEAIHKEIQTMRDKDLSDDQLKLVRYKILFVKRDYEVAFPEREELVHDNITGEAFTAWKIAEFIQRLESEPLPDKWKRKNYPERHEAHSVPNDGKIHRLDEDDKKFLRVYYEVLERYVREEDDTEVKVLKDIRKAIDKLPRLGGGSSGSGAGGGTGTGASGGGGVSASASGGSSDVSGTAGGGRGYSS
jgi:uncharacterized membrane protein YgcG